MANTRAHKEFHLIIPAAGSGQRFGHEIPKQYVRINGKMLLRHTLDAVMDWPGLQSVQVVIGEGHEHWYAEAVSGLDLPPPLRGGSDRNISIYNAINNISHVKNEDIILIHDAARPFVKWVDVAKLLDTLATDRAATLAVPVADTLRRSKEAQADDLVDRNGLWSIQTPQAFYYGDLKKAHEQADPARTYTDDTALVSALGIPVKLVQGSRSNIKITDKEDMEMAEALFQNRQNDIRTGTGYDVHAFDREDKNRPLILCGVRVEHPYGLAGHSDADVALHALTDALLGTIGGGDIGLHFPPSNQAFKDLDSRVCVEKAVDMLRDKNGIIKNVDITIICEEPKIGPHRDKMQEKVAEILGITADRVNIKATTTEKLGFTGRREGIAAQAVATVALHV